MKPTIGRIVIYSVTEQDVIEINRRRTTGSLIAERIKKNTPDSSCWPLGAQAHIGNEIKLGDKYPMIITRIWSNNCVNGQVFLDGNDCLWVTSATLGDNPHEWNWPTKS